jgi:hypothetical protein
MGVKLVVGELQKKLVRQFTTIETRTLTIWFYLSSIGLGSIILGLAEAIMGNYTLAITGVGIGIALSLVSVTVLDNGLEKEHTVATESGNVGPNA